MICYAIEEIAIDHPALLTGELQACTIARCRQFGKSPIENGTKAESKSRHLAKINQLKSGALFALGFPGYVFIMNFGLREAILSYSEGL